MSYVFENLTPAHDRTAFSCGVEPLDRYIKRQASQDVRRHVAAVVVAHAPGSTTVCGYYTLSAFAVTPVGLPDEITRRLPHYESLPATLLGRLAVDQRHQGQKLGQQLLMHALERSLLATQQIASMAVVVDAKDDRARQFYEHYKFARFLDEEYRLFLPMGTVKTLFSPPGPERP